MILFFDSSAYIALSANDDSFHIKATKFFQNLEPGTRFMTSNFVLTETITHINRRGGAKAANFFAEGILKSPRTTIVYIDLPIFHEALALLNKYHDKRLSFTDLTSFAIMRTHKLSQAFSFDSDFVKAGFQALP